MNLNDFENYIEAKIIERGADYHQKGNVISLKETDNNVFEAEVEGTEIYTVEVELDDEANIIDSQCDCPYDFGEFCKHQAAVFFALRNNYNFANTSELGKPQSRKKRKAPNLKEILAARTKEELIQFLLNIASEYKEIKQLLEFNFTDESDEDEIAQSSSLIRRYIKMNSEPDGFVAYNDVYEAVKGAELVLEKARLALEKNKTMHSLELVLCVIHEMMELLESADDSDGIIGGLISESVAFINEITNDEDLNPDDKENIFQKLIKEASNKQSECWSDWMLDFLEICSALVCLCGISNSWPPERVIGKIIKVYALLSAS